MSLGPSDIPPELWHLLEKRNDRDRRGRQRRKKQDRRKLDLGPLGALESADSLDDLPGGDRRRSHRRRDDRRRRNRRDN